MAEGNVPIFHNPVQPQTAHPNNPTPITKDDNRAQVIEKFRLWCLSPVKDAVVNMQFDRLVLYGDEHTVLEGLELLRKNRSDVFILREHELMQAQEL